MDERIRREQAAHADAAEILYGGIRAEACETAGEIASDPNHRLSLEAPTLETMTIEPGGVSVDCPQTSSEQYGDKVSALILGTSLLAGYGAAKAGSWWSERSFRKR